MSSLKRPPLTIVFDLDGTLVDTAPDLVAATNSILGRVGAPHVSVERLKMWVGSGARAMIVEGLRNAGGSFLGMSQDGTKVDQLLAEFLDYYEANIAVESRPFDGAEDALIRLRDMGHRLAVCTNKRESLSIKLLDALNLSPYFAAVAGRDTFPVSKPDPGHLTGAVTLANGTRDRAVMIGDSQTDILTAKRADIPVIAVTHGYTDRPVLEFNPTATIDHFSEIDAALSALALRHSS